MSIQGASREAMSVGQLVDGRICPPEQVIDWETTALSPREVALVNHVHGLLGDHIMGPEEVKIAIGLRTLGELQAFEEDSRAETEQQVAERSQGASFAVAVSDVDRKLSDGLMTTIDNLRFADKWGEIVPEITRRFSYEVPTPDGVIEDLSLLEVRRAVVRQATREGVARTLRFSLESHLDGLMSDRRWGDNGAPEVTLEIAGEDEEVTGRLERVHHDLDGGDWLEVRGESGRQRISHDTVKTLGITVTRTGVEEATEQDIPETEVDTIEPTLPRRRGLFRR